MKAFIKNILILANIFSITACTSYFWNGYYSDKKAVEEYDKKRDAYYAKETIEQKELRKKNINHCLNWINKTYPNPKFDYDLNIKKETLYKSCMEERGSPVFRVGK